MIDEAENAILYWGPKVGTLKSLGNYQDEVSKKQPLTRNLIGDMIDRFFAEVFGVKKASSVCANTADGSGPSLPWSNYFLTTPKIWERLAMFNVIASSWLDLRYPQSSAGTRECPANYESLEKNGVLAHATSATTKKACLYCRTSVWTNADRCKVGCHRCWSYVLEQMNLIFYRSLTDLVYVHDDKDCDGGGPPCFRN